MDQRSTYLWFRMNSLCDDLLRGTEEHGSFTIEEVRTTFETEIEQWEVLEDDDDPA